MITKLSKLVIFLTLAVGSAGCSRYKTDYKSYSPNPSYTKQQALDICRYPASAAGDTAQRNEQLKNPSYKTNCYRTYGRSVQCNTTQNTSGGSGFWGGFAKGVKNARIKRRASEGAMKACLAEKGWYEVKVPK
tara:strand:+ start:37 stop:435 length:399 start_codon:yes stop_codon:yes gene_type:complete